MLICTKRWKEPDAKNNSYIIYDTDDKSSDECSFEEVKNAFNLGFKIFGLIYNNGKVSVDSKKMSYSTEYRYYNGENMHIGVYSIEVVDTFALEYTEKGLKYPEVFTLKVSDTVNDRYMRFAIIDGENIYYTRAVQRLDPVHKMMPVCCGTVIRSKFENDYLYAISYEYYDKHYYREDEGKTFHKYELLWGSKTVAETEWLAEDYDITINVTDTGKFIWCHQDINLNIWR